MSKDALKIAAEIWSENLAIKAKVDGVLWLRRADPEQIASMVAREWRGLGQASAVVEFFASIDEEVRIVLDYAQRAGTGIAFRLDGAAAMAWLRQNRSDLPLAALPLGTRTLAQPTQRMPVRPQGSLAPASRTPTPHSVQRRTPPPEAPVAARSQGRPWPPTRLPLN